MWDESKYEGGIRDDKTFNSGMWDKNILAGTGFAYFERGELWDSFKIDGGIREEG